MNGSAQPAVTYGYDASGNLTSKSDYASSYTYHASRPSRGTATGRCARRRFWGVPITDRGFTDHEHLDDVELIHMNGRAYDYRLGRFLSVDPIIQAPGNSQSLNPYSYIMNNPLSGTDPSGYCSSGTRVKGADSATACHSVVLSRSSTARQQGTSTGSNNGAAASNSIAFDIGQASREPDEINSQLVGDQGGDFAIVVSYPKNYDNFGSIAID